MVPIEVRHRRRRSVNPVIKPLPKILKHPPVSLVRPPLRRLYHRPEPRRYKCAHYRLPLRHRTHRQPEGKLSHPVFPVPVQIWVQFFIEVQDDFRHPEMPRPTRRRIRIPDS